MSNADGFYVIAPKEFIVPVISGVAAMQPTTKGSLFISGVKLYFYDGSANRIVTSV